MENITIQIQATIGECGNYMPAANSEKETVSIVIAPLKDEFFTNKLMHHEGCNMFEGCYNLGCYYSAAARKKSREKR